MMDLESLQKDLKANKIKMMQAQRAKELWQADVLKATTPEEKRKAEAQVRKWEKSETLYKTRVTGLQRAIDGFGTGDSVKRSSSMNKKTLASELVRIAKSMIAVEFDSKKEMEDYKKEHDVKPGTKLTVVEDKKQDGKESESKPAKTNLKKDHPDVHRGAEGAVEFAKKITDMTPEQLSSDSNIRTFNKIGDLGASMIKKFKGVDDELAGIGATLAVVGHRWSGLPTRDVDEKADKAQDKKNMERSRDKFVDALSKLDRHMS